MLSPFCSKVVRQPPDEAMPRFGALIWVVGSTLSAQKAEMTVA
jgi:hypothetical protein